MKIKAVKAREILDSRGFPTVQADIVLQDGAAGSAAVPSGASTGSHEALELRDNDSRYNGKGVLKAVKNISKIEKILKGKDVNDIRALDQAMLDLDGTKNKSRLGANAILAVSMAALRAGAASAKKPLYRHIREVYGLKEKKWLMPTPMLNIINGGKHADSGLDVQEFMIVPAFAPSFKEALRAAAETYHVLKKDLAKKGMVTAVGDEGGFAPKISKHSDVLKTIIEAAKKAGYPKMSLALDAAASEFYHNGFYKFEGKNKTSAQMTAIYGDWIKRYPLLSIEDPLHEDDWDGWRHLTAKLGKKINIVGDDLFVTNKIRLERGIAEKAANSILIKLNQIGSVSETIDVIYLAKAAGYSCIISHRSGETEDSFIADLALAVNAGAIKTGAPARSERLAKYNRLLLIEEELGKKALYAKDTVFAK
ncbi:phosphopyruvate hydratase [Candidatus Proelusimicrobium volucris]|uniref:phosphopyruvate hydratase n=1 Tax=Candidatus Proelusimicrobium volucris TaxID=3416225 RepID=UPI003D117A00